MTLAATPMLKDQNAFQPTMCKSRKRVVKPIERKQKMKVQVRRDTSGVITLGRTALVKSGALKLEVNALIRIEARKNPMTNLGNRHQISRASGTRPVCPFSHTKVAIAANTTDQMPIHRSRPITFIKVKALIAASSLPTILP